MWHFISSISDASPYTSASQTQIFQAHAFKCRISCFISLFVVLTYWPEYHFFPSTNSSIFWICCCLFDFSADVLHILCASLALLTKKEKYMWQVYFYVSAVIVHMFQLLKLLQSHHHTWHNSFTWFYCSTASSIVTLIWNYENLASVSFSLYHSA